MLTQLLPTIYAIRVPVEARRLFISHLNYLCAEYKDKGYSWKEILIDEPLGGKWRIIGTVSADTIDFDCEPYVEYNDLHYSREKSQIMPLFKCYEGKYSATTNKDESFRSLLNSKGARWVNPYPKPIAPFQYSIMEEGLHERYKEKLSQWQAAEQFLIKGKLVVLERI